MRVITYSFALSFSIVLSIGCESQCRTPLQPGSIAIDGEADDGDCRAISVDVFLGTGPVPTDSSSAREFRVRSTLTAVQTPTSVVAEGDVALVCVGRDPASARECIAVSSPPEGAGVVVSLIDSSGQILLSPRGGGTASTHISYTEETLLDACADAMRGAICGDQGALLERCLDESVNGCLLTESIEARQYFSCFEGSEKICSDANTITSCQAWCGFPGDG
jgi:hypothetical protein